MGEMLTCTCTVCATDEGDVIRQVQGKAGGDILLRILQVERLCFDHTGQRIDKFRILRRRP